METKALYSITQWEICRWLVAKLTLEEAAALRDSTTTTTWDDQMLEREVFEVGRHIGCTGRLRSCGRSRTRILRIRNQGLLIIFILILILFIILILLIVIIIISLIGINLKIRQVVDIYFIITQQIFTDLSETALHVFVETTLPLTTSTECCGESTTHSALHRPAIGDTPYQWRHV